MVIKHIDIYKTDIQKYQGLELVAFHWAAAGACGEHGGVVFITKDRQVYHTNYVTPKYGISWDDLFDIFPLFEKIQEWIYGHSKDNIEWEYTYLGLGNYLVVNKKYWKDFNLAANAALQEKHKVGNDDILYNVWIEAMVKVLNEQKHKTND